MNQEKLQYFLNHYGPDFFKKLPRYKTARLAGVPVGLRGYDAEKMVFLVSHIGGAFSEVPVWELDNFVL